LIRSKTTRIFSSVTAINAEFTGKLARRLHLDPLLWLLEKDVFDKDLANNMEMVVTSLKKSGKGLSSGEDSPKKRTKKQSKSWMRGLSLPWKRNGNRMVKQSHTKNTFYDICVFFLVAVVVFNNSASFGRVQ